MTGDRGALAPLVLWPQAVVFTIAGVAWAWACWHRKAALLIGDVADKSCRRVAVGQVHYVRR